MWYSQRPAWRRVLPLVAGCLAVLLGVAGCGEDLSRANYEPTTVPPEPGSGATEPIPEGPVDEPALAVDQLRSVDACQAFDEEQVGLLGELDPNPYNEKPDECGRTLTDDNGTKVRISLKIGEDLTGLRDKASGGLEGLPLRENQLDNAVCFVQVLTSEAPELGLQVHISYDGGNSCGSGRRVMAKVIQSLKDNPPQMSTEDGSLQALDPCSTIDDSTADDVAEDAEKQPSGLHGCSLRGAGPVITVNFRIGVAPERGNEREKLSDDVTAEVTTRGGNTCRLQWAHREVSDTEYENVNVEYADYSADADIDDGCDAAVTLAKNVDKNLPDA